MDYEIENIELRNANKLAHEKIKALEKDIENLKLKVQSYNPHEFKVEPHNYPEELSEDEFGQIVYK